MRALELAHFGQDLENQDSPYEALIIAWMMREVNCMNVLTIVWI